MPFFFSRDEGIERLREAGCFRGEAGRALAGELIDALEVLGILKVKKPYGRQPVEAQDNPKVIDITPDNS